jgi:hypothetical protein
MNDQSYLQDMRMDKKIFVLGDSRTGTTSLHKLLLDYGCKSIHYYVDEVNEIAHREGYDRHKYKHIRQFIENSGFNAFSDYPTRCYFVELLRDYPDAYFILSTRKDVQTWVGSMERYFPHRTEVLANLAHLSDGYLELNKQIRQRYASAERFIEICIDDGNEVNSPILADFLGRAVTVPLKKLNAT